VLSSTHEADANERRTGTARNSSLYRFNTSDNLLTASPRCSFTPSHVLLAYDKSDL